VVETSKNSNQPKRVSFVLDVDFRALLTGGLPTCSELCRRREAMRSTLASTPGLGEFKSKEFERIIGANT
jgi:hypothetical protein